MYMNSVNSNNTDYTLSSFGNVFVSSNATADSKTVTFPNGYNLDSNLSFKVVFTNGHAVDNDTTNMTLNGIPVVVNRYGTLIPIPNHKLSDSSTIYSTLQANTVLEMYYTNNHDGNNNPAFVVVGNPVVLSSIDYTVYADGKVGDEQFGTIKSRMTTQAVPYGWLLCDDTWHNKNELNYRYWNLWNALPSSMKSGDNFIVDLRELVLVGAGQQNYFTISAHDVYNLGDFRDDQMESHNHYINHYHDKGTMKITGSVYSVFGSNQGGDGPNEGHFHGDGCFTTQYQDYASSWDGGNAGGLKQKRIILDTDNTGSWTGRSGICIDNNGNPYEYSGPNSGRTWTTTHGKQIGVFYMIKWAP